MKKLSKKELNELKGGSDPITDQDVNNLNNSIGCKCLYNNNAVITNTNTVEGCMCNCTLTQS